MTKKYGSYKTKLEYIDDGKYYYLGDGKMKKFLPESVKLSDSTIKDCIKFSY